MSKPQGHNQPLHFELDKNTIVPTSSSHLEKYVIYAIHNINRIQINNDACHCEACLMHVIVKHVFKTVNILVIKEHMLKI